MHFEVRFLPCCVVDFVSSAAFYFLIQMQNNPFLKLIMRSRIVTVPILTLIVYITEQSWVAH